MPLAPLPFARRTRCILVLLAGLALESSALAASYTLEQIAFAAEEGLPDATIRRMAESRTDWDLEAEEVATLLARGVSDEIVFMMTGGAHPTDADWARADEIREQPAGEPDLEEEDFDPNNTLGVVEVPERGIAKGRARSTRLVISEKRVVTARRLGRAHTVGTIGLAGATAGPALVIAGAFAGSAGLVGLGTVGMWVGPSMLLGSSCRGANVLRRSGYSLSNSSCVAGWTVYLGGQLASLGIDLATGDLYYGYSSTGSTLVAVGTYVAAVVLGTLQHTSNRDFAVAKRLAAAHSTPRRHWVRLSPAPVGDRGGLALVGGF